MSAGTFFLGGHGIIAPVVLPLVAGSLLLLIEKHRPSAAGPISLISTLALVLVGTGLVQQASGGAVQPYLLGNWPAPFGIALALDRLSAMMLLLTAVVATGSLLYALGGDDRRGVHFHALFQFQLMGLNGAFLTADLFNLFVFFEVLLAASYGLLLHGSGAGRRERLKSSVHYVVFNLAGSALFLVAVSLLYGLTGTLNMADLARRLAALSPENARLAQAAALMLLVVFSVKAALLPLYFWLPDTYASATAPVAALFAIMTKVGVYAIARVSTLMFGEGAGPVAGVATPFLPWLALATLALAAVGALAAVRVRGLLAYGVVASAGTLLLAIGLGTEAALAAGLFYLLNSTLIAAALFLLADRIMTARGGSDRLEPRALAGGWAPLGVGFFVAAVAAAGVPPLAGFLGKTMLLQAAGTTSMATWVIAVVLGSSLAMMVALARAGSTLFWSLPDTGPTTMQKAAAAAPSQSAAIVAMMAAALTCAVAAGPISAYTAATAAQLQAPQGYIGAVLGAQAAPPAWDIRREMRERGEAK
jgi:multicomponent K+:H+ antiporter subunit D